MGGSFVQSPPKFRLAFPNFFDGLFTRWRRGINPKDSGSAPSGTPGHPSRNVWTKLPPRPLCRQGPEDASPSFFFKFYIKLQCFNLNRISPSKTSLSKAFGCQNKPKMTLFASAAPPKQAWKTNAIWQEEESQVKDEPTLGFLFFFFFFFSFTLSCASTRASAADNPTAHAPPDRAAAVHWPTSCLYLLDALSTPGRKKKTAEAAGGKKKQPRKKCCPVLQERWQLQCFC